MSRPPLPPPLPGAPSEAQRQKSAPVAAMVAAPVCGAVAWMVLKRAGEGIQPYGVHGAAWIEHAERLTFVQAWSHRSELGFFGWLDEIDGLFPPALHAVTSLFGVLFGHGSADLAWTGLLWLLLLALALAAVTGELGGRATATAAAFAGVCLLPAAHAFATRYYYDLPMTAVLWLAVALALRSWDEQPVVGGLAAGVLWAFADLIKWAALPFGGLLLLAAALTPAAGPFRPGRRLVGLTLATAVSAGVSALWISAAGGESSLGVMLEQMWGGAGGGGGSVSELLAGLGGWIADKGVFLGTRLQGGRVSFYAVQTFTAVLSPALGILLVLLALRGGWKAATLLFATTLLLGGFLVLWIPILDERFVLTAAPALVPAAAIGLSRLPRPAIVPVAVVVAGVGLWVGAAFHGLAPDLPGPTWESTPGADSAAPPLKARGLGLVDSVERRGWSHARTTPSPHTEVRESIWRALAREAPKLVAIPDPPFDVSPAGEFHWLDYRSLLAEVEENVEVFEFVEHCESEADLVLAGVERGMNSDCTPWKLIEVRRWLVGDERYEVVMLGLLR